MRKHRTQLIKGMAAIFAMLFFTSQANGPGVPMPHIPAPTTAPSGNNLSFSPTEPTVGGEALPPEACPPASSTSAFLVVAQSLIKLIALVGICLVLWRRVRSVWSAARRKRVSVSMFLIVSTLIASVVIVVKPDLALSAASCLQQATELLFLVVGALVLVRLFQTEFFDKCTTDKTVVQQENQHVQD